MNLSMEIEKPLPNILNFSTFIIKKNLVIEINPKNALGVLGISCEGEHLQIF